MNYQTESQKTLSRILAKTKLTGLSGDEKTQFIGRLSENFERLFTLYHEVYGWQYDFFYHLQELVQTLAASYSKRSKALKEKDQSKLNKPGWYKSNKMLGMACYVDLYGGDFSALQKRIPYLKHTGINYLHLMPLYKSPEGDSDGGYAVSDYRQTAPSLGSLNELKKLAQALQKADINLVLDFVKWLVY